MLGWGDRCERLVYVGEDDADDDDMDPGLATDCMSVIFGVSKVPVPLFSNI